MSAIRRKYHEGFKKNIVWLSYASNKPIAEVANALGIEAFRRSIFYINELWKFF